MICNCHTYANETNMNTLIDKYLSHEATPQEVTELLRWVKENDANKQEFTDACSLWYSLHSNKFNSDKAFADFEKKTAKKTISIALWQKLSAVAAIALIIIGCFTVFNRSQIENITITNNELAISNVTLPDGSTIYLHQGASVTYPSEFPKEKRTISATGNIFCEIFHDETAPFTLIDSNLTITVLGTSFHVNTIDETYVVVESGKVSVSNGSQSVLLETGERADLQNGTLIASANTDVNLLSWKTGILKFSNTPLSHVYSDLARHYHCEFTYATPNTEVPQFNLTGTYQDMTLQETLQTIELTIPQVHYECSDSKVLVNYQK